MYNTNPFKKTMHNFVKTTSKPLFCHDIWTNKKAFTEWITLRRGCIRHHNTVVQNTTMVKCGWIVVTTIPSPFHPMWHTESDLSRGLYFYDQHKFDGCLVFRIICLSLRSAVDQPPQFASFFTFGTNSKQCRAGLSILT